MQRQTLLAAVGLAALAGCGNPPTRSEIEDAQARVRAFMTVGDTMHMTITMMRILPDYVCGEPERTVVGRVADDMKQQFACATVSTQVVNELSDAVVVDFGDAGCDFGGRKLTGPMRFIYSGGDETVAVEGDFTELKVDGVPLQAKGGYSLCDDEHRVWARANGDLSFADGLKFELDAQFDGQDGVPIFGDFILTLNGAGSVFDEKARDRASFEHLKYVVGEYFPEQGSLMVETSGGHRVRATFAPVFWRLGEVELEINDYDPVTVPLVR